MGIQYYPLVKTIELYSTRSGSYCESESEVAQSCLTLCDPWTVAHQAPPSMGFSRQEYWSGLPFPSPGIFKTLQGRDSQEGGPVGKTLHFHCQRTKIPQAM